MSKRMGWQEWFRNNIAHKSYTPKSAAAKAWVYQKAEIEQLRRCIAELEKENTEQRKQIDKWKIRRWQDAGCPIGDGE